MESTRINLPNVWNPLCSSFLSISFTTGSAQTWLLDVIGLSMVFLCNKETEKITWPGKEIPWTSHTDWQNWVVNKFEIWGRFEWKGNFKFYRVCWLYRLSIPFWNWVLGHWSLVKFKITHNRQGPLSPSLFRMHIIAIDEKTWTHASWTKLHRPVNVISQKTDLPGPFFWYTKPSNGQVLLLL